MEGSQSDIEQLSTTYVKMLMEYQIYAAKVFFSSISYPTTFTKTGVLLKKVR